MATHYYSTHPDKIADREGCVRFMMAKSYSTQFKTIDIGLSSAMKHAAKIAAKLILMDDRPRNIDNNDTFKETIHQAIVQNAPLLISN